MDVILAVAVALDALVVRLVLLPVRFSHGAAEGCGTLLLELPCARTQEAVARTGRAEWLSRSRSAVSRSGSGIPMPIGTDELRSQRHWAHSTTHVRSGRWAIVG